MSDNEPDGMLAVAIGIAEQRWPHSVDAQVWADEWLKTIAEHPEVPTDREAMIGWFANAIMAGYDTAMSRAADHRKQDFAAGALAACHHQGISLSLFPLESYFERHMRYGGA